MMMIIIYVFRTSRRVLRRAMLGNYKQSAILTRSQNHKGKKTPFTDSPGSLIPRCYSAPGDPRKHFKLRRKKRPQQGSSVDSPSVQGVATHTKSVSIQSPSKFPGNPRQNVESTLDALFSLLATPHLHPLLPPTIYPSCHVRLLYTLYPLY